MLMLLRGSHVSMMTFGGFQSWVAKEGEKFYFDFVKERNDSFLIVQSGLNFYVFEASAVALNSTG